MKNFTVQTVYLRPVGGRITSKVQVVAETPEQAERMARASNAGYPIRTCIVKKLGSLHPGFYTLTMEAIQGEPIYKAAYDRLGA